MTKSKYSNQGKTIKFYFLNLTTILFVFVMSGALAQGGNCDHGESELKDIIEITAETICGDESGKTTRCGVDLRGPVNTDKCEDYWETKTDTQRVAVIFNKIYGEGRRGRKFFWCPNISHEYTLNELFLEEQIGHVFSALWGPVKCDGVWKKQFKTKLGLEDGDARLDRFVKGCTLNVWKVWKQIKPGEFSQC